MEKFYIVTEESDLRECYLKYQENNNTIHKLVNEFLVKYDVKAKDYGIFDNTLYIVPENDDLENFKNKLGKDVGNGLRPFKKTSKIAKDWISTLEEKGLVVLGKPYVGIYFDKVWGKHSSRLFEKDGVVYCSMASECDFNNPKGMTEIKASEFYKVIEEWENEKETM